MSSFSDYLVFVDESGDHGLASIDPDYPVFVLAFCIVMKNDYKHYIVPELNKFKVKHLGSKKEVLHERHIRKAIKPFNFLLVPELRESFFNDLNRLMIKCPVELIASVIRKTELFDRYIFPENPYDLALAFGLERIFLHLHSLGCKPGKTNIMFESRGEKEDDNLELEFRRVCERNATNQTLPFTFLKEGKGANIPGLQLADLVARPIGRSILDPSQPNRAYEILEKKFIRSPGGNTIGWGLKIFP